MIKKILLIGAVITAITTTTWADTQEPDSFCPDFTALHKNPTKGNWTAETKDGKWKSFDMSFATNITKFIGAQWAGENVGQVTCIYDSEQQFTMQGQPTVQATLPVLLVFHTLTLQPTTGKWKHIKRGVYNCNSFSQKDCPFKINMKPSVGNILQEAESLKTTDDSQSLQPID